MARILQEDRNRVLPHGRLFFIVGYQRVSESGGESMSKEEKKNNVMIWVIFSVCVVLMVLGELERNRIITITAASGFIYLIVAYLYKEIGGK